MIIFASTLINHNSRYNIIENDENSLELEYAQVSINENYYKKFPLN